MNNTKKATMTTTTTPIPERIQALISRPDSIYLGPCIVQAPAAWSRSGPTWLVPGVGWVTRGPGLRDWGTTKGLAQLAVDSGCAPKWHATAWTIAERPNLVFAIEEQGITADYMAEVRALTEEFGA